MTIDRQVAGLWCHDVLAQLSDYVDGDLPDAARALVEEHLRGCDACARFGGEFTATVRSLREQLLSVEPAAPSRLRERLRAALDSDQS